MPVWVTDESGGSLAGTLDGRNRVFTTRQDMRTDRLVDVFVNGQRRAQGLGNGYALTSSRTVTLDEPPVAEDTVAVSYCTDALVPAVREGFPKDLVITTLTPLPVTARALDKPAPMRVRQGSCPPNELPRISEERNRPSMED